MKPSITKHCIIRGLLLTGLAGMVAVMARAQAKEEDETIQLSPFVVTDDGSRGYYASSSLAGTRLKTELRDVASSIQVITREFMDDVGALNANSLLQYTTSTETAGIQGNFVGVATPSSDQTSSGDARQNPESTNRVRGLGSPDQTRGYFKTDIPFDSYNITRVDINRGANSFLFGLGSPAGLINTTLAMAEFTDSNEITTRVGTGGNRPSYRGSVNFNRNLIDKVLAVRVAALADRTQYRQRPTYRNDDRLYAAVTFKPFRNTTLRAHFESGKIDANPPDVLLPAESLSTFLHEPIVGRAAIDMVGNMRNYNNVEGPYNGVPNASSLINFQGGNHWALIWDGTTSDGRPAYARTNGIRGVDFANGNPYWDPTGNGKGNVGYVHHGNLAQINGPGWVLTGFTDLETFDFSRYNLGGNNDFYRRDFDNYNVSLEQLLFKGKAGFELAFDRQHYDTDSFATFHAGIERIFMDINPTLLHPTAAGSLVAAPNPNFGRPAIMTQTWRSVANSRRDASRLTAFVAHDFRASLPEWVGRLLGSHRATVLADQSSQERKFVSYKLASFGDPDPATALQGGNALMNAETFSRTAFRMIYVGPPQPQAFSDPNFTMADFQLTPVTENISLPADYSIPVFYWDRGAASSGDESWRIGTFEPRLVPTNTHTLTDSKVTSIALNTQSKLLDDLLVVNLGWREDKVEMKDRINDAPLVDGVRQVDATSWNLDGEVATEIKEDVFGYGLVLNWPQKLVRLPAGTDAAFHFNDSKNFAPEAGLSDLYGKTLPSPTGKSREYGFTVFLFENKVVARINRFEGALANTLGGSYWRMVNATGNDMMSIYGNLNQWITEIDADGNGRIDPDVENQELYVNFDRARSARALLGPMLSQDFRDRFSYVENPDGSFTSAGQNATLTDLADVTTKGTEAEIVLNPTNAWRIAVNVARYETSLTNIAPRLSTFVNQAVLPYLREFGDMDFNRPLEAVEGNTAQAQLNAQLLELFAAQSAEGTPQLEQRKWRANLITNYRFVEGALKGLSVGGAARWQDKYAIGYALLENEDGIVVDDINKPYWSDDQLAIDLWVGYRRKVFRDIDWSIQLNIQNVNNWNSDHITAVRAQPNGDVARVRFDPPREIFVTNTFSF